MRSSRGWLVPALVVLLLAAAALLLPSLRTLLASPQGIAVAVGIAAAFVGLSALLRKAPAWVRALGLGLPALALVAWVGLPSVADRRVDEELPGAASAVAAPQTEEAAGASAGDEAPLPAEAAAPAATATPADEQPTEAAEPVRLAAGSLTGIDHEAEGGAALYALPDGTGLARLEEVDIEPGPDYRLYLVPAAGATTPDGGVDLGPLAGNVGSSNYPLPAGTATEGEQTLLVWCRAFAVPIAAATLAP